MPNTTISTGALVEMDRFGTNPGRLKAFLYLPYTFTPGSALVVALHGCTQPVPDFALHSGWLVLADRFGFAMLFPEQQHGNNAHLCFNWFEPLDIRRDQGEAGSIRQMTEHVLSAHAVDPRKVFIVGFSAGGAMANAVLALYPDLFSAGSIIAGLPFATAMGAAEAYQRMQDRQSPPPATLRRSVRRVSPKARTWPRISIWQCSHDHTVRQNNSDHILEQWRGPHGLTQTPSRSETIGSHVHKTWLDGKGQLVLETYRIRSAGHGIPFATGSENPLGKAEPFMLETDISATARIAAFFGLVGSETVRQAEGDLPVTAKKPRRTPRKTTAKPAPRSSAVMDRRLKTMLNKALRLTRIGR